MLKNFLSLLISSAGIIACAIFGGVYILLLHKIRFFAALGMAFDKFDTPISQLTINDFFIFFGLILIILMLILLCFYIIRLILELGEKMERKIESFFQ